MIILISNFNIAGKYLLKANFCNWYSPASYDLSYHQSYFSKFYGKFGVISWLLFPTSFEKNYILQTLTWKLELWSFSTCFTFTHEKRQEKNFYHKNFMAENNHVLHWSLCIWIYTFAIAFIHHCVHFICFHCLPI